MWMLNRRKQSHLWEWKLRRGFRIKERREKGVASRQNWFPVGFFLSLNATSSVPIFWFHSIRRCHYRAFARISSCWCQLILSWFKLRGVSESPSLSLEINGKMPCNSYFLRTTLWVNDSSLQKKKNWRMETKMKGNHSTKFYGQLESVQLSGRWPATLVTENKRSKESFIRWNHGVSQLFPTLILPKFLGC